MALNGKRDRQGLGTRGAHADSRSMTVRSKAHLTPPCPHCRYPLVIYDKACPRCGKAPPFEPEPLPGLVR